jgi:hypothetical protein
MHTVSPVKPEVLGISLRRCLDFQYRCLIRITITLSLYGGSYTTTEGRQSLPFKELQRKRTNSNAQSFTLYFSNPST